MIHTRPLPLSIAASLCIALAAACGADPVEPDVPPPAEGTLIRASTGGTVQLGDVTLTVPPGSLSADTTISIAAETAAPTGDADGFVVAGASFRFSPPGTQFALAKPAILTMPYDAAALAGQGLDGRTLQLAYFDEDLGRYFSIGGEVDPETGLVTARVEHFTLYVAMAASLVPGNNAPTIALQSPIPATIRAGSPVYLRATVRDYDVGGSVAGVTLHYRSATTGGAFATLPMAAETTLDTFGALIPASALVDAGAADLEYYVTAVDNLRASRESTHANVDLVRSYAAGTLVLSPATPAIAAGFERVFVVQGRDDLNALYALVPETSGASGGIGTTSIGSAGVTFRATTAGSGEVTAGFSAQTASLPVTVFNGALERIAILDDDGNEIEGTLTVKEGTRVQLDALGYDAYGNTVLVNPVWTADANLGTVSALGLVDTVDGYSAGRVQASVGAVVASQWFSVTTRLWETQAILGQSEGEQTGYQKLASRNGVVYAAYLSTAGNNLRVRHQVGDTWVDDGAPAGTAAVDSLAIAAGTTRLQVAWVEGTHVYAAHLEGTTWVQDGGALEVETDTGIALGHLNNHVELAFDGDTPYVAWSERHAQGYRVHVRRWNGTSWVLIGGQVQAANQDAYLPSLAIHDGTPYVAYQCLTGCDTGSRDIYVRRWTGAEWELVGGLLDLYPNLDSNNPKLTFLGGAPVVAYRQDLVNGTLYPVYVQRWNGTSWAQIDPGGLFTPPSYLITGSWSIAADGDVLYAAWLEYHPALVRRHISKRNPHTGVWSDIGTWAGALVPYFEISMIVNGTTPYVAQDEYVGAAAHVRVMAYH
jgi:hypothetical protein